MCSKLVIKILGQSQCSILYPLKKSENQMFSDVSRGSTNGTLTLFSCLQHLHVILLLLSLNTYLIAGNDFCYRLIRICIVWEQSILKYGKEANIITSVISSISCLALYFIAISTRNASGIFREIQIFSSLSCSPIYDGT